MSVFDQMMLRYEIKADDDKRNAIHEVMQEIALRRNIILPGRQVSSAFWKK